LLPWLRERDPLLWLRGRDPLLRLVLRRLAGALLLPPPERPELPDARELREDPLLLRADPLLLRLLLRELPLLPLLRLDLLLPPLLLRADLLLPLLPLLLREVPLPPLLRVDPLLPREVPLLPRALLLLLLRALVLLPELERFPPPDALLRVLPDERRLVARLDDPRSLATDIFTSYTRGICSHPRRMSGADLIRGYPRPGISHHPGRMFDPR
jgi:hypothetical protein